jgi:glycosyltransferase involved in cell wall biosynthesis
MSYNPRVRLGVYADLVYRRDDSGVSAPSSFISWVLGLAPHLDELVIFGRVQPIPGRAAYAIDGPRVRFHSLPYYENLRRPRQLAAATSRSVGRWRSQLPLLDAVILFGPHPLAVLFGMQARAAHIPVIVGVRQDFPRYVASRVGGTTARWAVPAARVLEACHRRMARWGGAIVVGADLGRRYGAPGRSVFVTGVSLVRSEDLVPLSDAKARSWPGNRRALTVGRLDPEKNPLLLIDILTTLRRRDSWTLAVAGTGSLDGQLAQRARARSVDGALDLLGQIDGGRLRDLYRESTVFIHVSWTEGQPQVLFEAAAAGIPIIATAVGGVPDALQGGIHGLLVPPNDVEAVLQAIDRLGAEPELRIAMVEAALEWVAGETIDQQTARLASFVKDVARRGPRTGKS